jgi:hypothetical protein
MRTARRHLTTATTKDCPFPTEPALVLTAVVLMPVMARQDISVGAMRDTPVMPTKKTDAQVSLLLPFNFAFAGNHVQ